MDHLTRCILFVLCTVPLALGCSMIAVGSRRNKKLQNGLGIALTSLSGIACMIFGFGMFFTLRWGYLLTAALVSVPLAVVVLGMHEAIDKTMSERGTRGLLRFLLTVLHLGLCVVCMQCEGHDMRALAIAIAIVSALLMSTYSIVWKRHRAKKLAESPVMQQVVELCRAHNCVAVQLLPYGVRFFDHLPNLEFLKGETYRSHTPTFIPPEHWAPWFCLGAWCRELKFADYDYPNMTIEQLELCALGLKRKMDGFKSCYHSSYHKVTSHKPVYDEFNEKRIADGTVVTTHLYYDELLYKASARQTLEQTRTADEERREKVRRDAESKRNSWE